MRNTLVSIIDQLSLRTFHTEMNDGQTVPVKCNGAFITTHHPQSKYPHFTITVIVWMNDIKFEIETLIKHPSIQSTDSTISDYMIEQIAEQIFNNIRNNYDTTWPTSNVTLAFVNTAQDNK